MKNRLWFFATMMLILAAAFAIACGNGNGDDDDDDDNDDAGGSPGTCDSYCDKVISCGDVSWTSTDECAAVCEISPKKVCMLSCEISSSCGDFFDCLAGC